MGDSVRFRLGTEFKAFLTKLSNKDRAKMIRTIQAILQLGMQSVIRQKYVKKLEKMV